MRYAKLHGCENAYVYVRAEAVRGQDLAELARAVSRARPQGVGSDGLIVCAPSDVADVRMIMFNADGSRAAMCGNGIRGLAKWVLDQDADTGAVIAEATDLAGLRARIGEACPPLGEACAQVEWPSEEAASLRRIAVETDSGTRVIFAVMVAGNMHLAAVDMGMAVRGFALAGSAKPVEQVELNAAGIAFSLALVATGNQHAVTFVDDVDAIALERLGPAIQSAAAFADPVNVHFVQRIDRRTLRMRPWERGSGATRACGTGACAAAFAAPDVDRLVTVIQPGGSVFVHLDWLGDDKASCRVHMIGSAGLVETGDWNPPG